MTSRKENVTTAHITMMSALLLLLELDRKHLPQDLAERMEGWHNHNFSTLRSIPIRIRLLGGMANTAPTN